MIVVSVASNTCPEVSGRCVVETVGVDGSGSISSAAVAKDCTEYELARDSDRTETAGGARNDDGGTRLVL